MDAARPASATDPPGYSAAREGLAHRIRPAGVVDVAGEERVVFLQGQLTQEMRDLTPGQTRETAGLTPKGKLLFVARVVGFDDRLRLVVPEALRQLVLDHLRKYAVFTKVAIEDRSADFLRVGLYGAGGASWAAPAEALRLPGQGEFSAELLVPAAMRGDVERLLEVAGSHPVPAETAEILRLEVGRPRFGSDMDSSNLPDEVGMDDAISTAKGCYVGQEVVARLRTYGRVNRRLVSFRFPEGSVDAGEVLRSPGEETPSKVEAGRVTSSVVSPRLGPIGLGYAFREVPSGSRLVSTSKPHLGAVVGSTLNSRIAG